MAPKSKKRVSEVDFSSDGDENDHLEHSKKAKLSATRSKATSSTSGGAKNVDDNGDTYWEVSKARRVTISEFRGKTLVNIREYYEKDGKELPGKKGISLPIEQFSALVTLLPDIEDALRQKGQSIPRPDYSGRAAPGEDADEDLDSENGDNIARSPKKKNIDATSDEDDDDDEDR